METLKYINYLVTVVFTVCYAYQFLYIPIVWFARRKKADIHPTIHDFAVLICARNEETVIGDLIDSLQHQTYPREHIHIFVMADNCTDRTAAVAQRAGAIVYSRFSTEKIGKGYALECLMQSIRRDFPEGFDGYMVFDADNILAPDYVERMNETFSGGAEIITSYRNSKNYGASWISAGYALWFLRESRYLNHARSLCGCSCMVSGTGFLFSRRVAEEMEAWHYFLLTEDIEFSADQITKGRIIAFCPEAELYDEQPVDFSTSWRQRMRWAKGYLQVFRDYGGRLLKGCCRGSFSCVDMTMSIMPAFVLSAISVVCNLMIGLWGAYSHAEISIALRSVCELLRNMYLLLFVLGGITLATEWKHVHEKPTRKLLLLLSFPLFMFTYIPISLAALFCKTGWKPIKHTYCAEKMGREKMEALRKLP